MIFKNLKSTIKMEKKSKINHFDFWYIFLVTLYFGGSSAAFLGMTYYINNISVAIPLIYTIFVFFKYRLKLSYHLITSLVIVLLWFLLQYIYNGYFNIVDCSFYLYNIIVAFTIINSYGSRFFYIFEKVIYVLAIISIIGWGICLFGGRDILASLAPFDGNKIIDGSFGIFSVVNQRNDLDEIYYSVIRNSGFCSEPGHYSAILCLAIVFNLFFNKFEIKSNRHLWVFLVALLSTQSTTGYFILGIVVIPLLLLNNRYRSKWLIYGLSLCGICLIATSSVVAQKLEDTQYSEANLYEVVDKVNGYQEGLVAQRFDSFAIESVNFQENPLIGYGFWQNSFFYNHISPYLRPSNGCITILAKHGIFIGILYYVSLVLSCITISREFQVKGALFLFLLYLCFLFSYDFQTRNIMLVFVLYRVFKCDKMQKMRE